MYIPPVDASIECMQPRIELSIGLYRVGNLRMHEMNEH